MVCPICNSTKTRTIFSKFSGYIENTNYNIFECADCDTQFIDMKKVDTKIYDLIYGQEKTPGYDRYFNYANNVKNSKNPLKWLSLQESTYYPIYMELKQNNKKLKILEVGCGYGYLTYSLRKMGHEVFGIDIAKNAIKFAKQNFGNYFSLGSINDIHKKDKFDIIIATELIEHLQNPAEFISLCTNLLKDKGKIIITTPNKDYSPKKTIWKTDLPPVHTVWLSKKSFENLSNQNNLKCNFVDFSKYVSIKENKLISYLLSILHQSTLPLPILDKNGQPYHKRVAISNSRVRKIAKTVIFSYPIKLSSHILAKLFNSESQTLGVILIKK